MYPEEALPAATRRHTPHVGGLVVHRILVASTMESRVLQCSGLNHGGMASSRPQGAQLGAESTGWRALSRPARVSSTHHIGVCFRLNDIGITKTDSTHIDQRTSTRFLYYMYRLSRRLYRDAFA